MALTQTQVSQLYVAIFNRASEGKGNTFWQKAGTKVEAANSMLDTQDAKDYFGTSINSNKAFIETIYKNTLNKTLADDEAGIAFWTAALDSGMSRGEVVSGLIDAIESYKNSTDPKTKAAYDQFNNRVQVSDYMAEEVTTAPTDYKTSTQFAPLGTLNVDNTATSVSTAKNTVDNMIVIDGKTIALTAGADNFTGSEKNDVFNAYDVGDAVVKQTLNAVDQLDGGAGKDILNVSSDTAIAKVNANITNIETINLRSGSSVTFDTTNYTGVETLNVKQGTVISATAGEKTDINVSGATGAITTANGKNINITDSTAGNAIISAGAAGTITVTDTNQGTGTITVNDGTDVTITASSLKNVAAGAITVGTTKAATGDVKITQNNISDGTAVASNGTITVTGGKTVDVTVNSTSTAADSDSDLDITNGTITVTGDGKTTDVTVKQNNTVNTVIKAEVAEVKATQTVTFKAATAGQTVIVNGLTFTAAKNLTAEEVAQAFANLTAGANQAAGGITANGIFTGANSSVATWTSGVANGATVTYTGGAYNTTTMPAVGGSAAPTLGTLVPGTNKVLEDESANTINSGTVTINDNATASIKTITLDSYGVATIGGTVAVNALTDLTLTNSAGTATVTTAVTTLNLNVNDVQANVTLTAANLKTLNLTTTGEDSKFGLSAAAVETLTIAAAADLDIATGSTLSALKTVNITGAGDVALGDVSGTLETLAASASTGDISARVDGTKATVTTGAGDDVITVDTTTVTKAIDLGAGDDRLDLSTFTDLTGLATISGGTGTDTVVLAAANAAVANLSSTTNSAIFKDKVTGFEKLEIGVAAAGVTVNVGNLGYNYVITNANTALLTLEDMANNGTVELNGVSTGGTTVQVKDAATGLTDVLNVIANVAADVNNGTLTAVNVETINITATDTTPVNTVTGAATINTSILDLDATSAKTVNVKGNANLTLDMAGNTAATTIDGSTMTGDLTVTASNASMTVKGGAGNDIITIATAAKGSSIYGNGGDDKFVIGTFTDLVTIYGGAGKDIFDFNGVSTNKSNYVVLNGVDSGDTIDLTGVYNMVGFNAAKITLSAGATETTQAYLDQAMTTLAQGQVGWFQYNGNTYVTADASAESANSFLDGQDFVTMITGLVDLSQASFNATTDTLVIA